MNQEDLNTNELNQISDSDDDIEISNNKNEDHDKSQLEKNIEDYSIMINNKEEEIKNKKEDEIKNNKEVEIKNNKEKEIKNNKIKLNYDMFNENLNKPKENDIFSSVLGA